MTKITKSKSIKQRINWLIKVLRINKYSNHLTIIKLLPLTALLNKDSLRKVSFHKMKPLNHRINRIKHLSLKTSWYSLLTWIIYRNQEDQIEIQIKPRAGPIKRHRHLIHIIKQIKPKIPKIMPVISTQVTWVKKARNLNTPTKKNPT